MPYRERSAVTWRDDGPGHDATDVAAGAPATGDADVDPDSDDEYRPRRSRNPYLRFKGRPRAGRRADGRFIHSRRAVANARPAREVWIERHQQRIHTAVTELLEQAARLGFTAMASEDDEEPGLGDYLAWITEDTVRGVAHGTFGSIGLVLGELRSRPAVTALARQHGIHRAVAAADRLRRLRRAHCRPAHLHHARGEDVVNGTPPPGPL